MSYQIRPATISDLPRILPIYQEARQFMRESGNPNQWGSDRPTESTLKEDIAKGQLFLCTDKEETVCVFAYIPGTDPTYLVIDNGAWLNDAPYGVIHRIAVATRGKGVATYCFQWALAQCPNLRIDTHSDNIPMQAALRKNGFAQCGIIYLSNGDPRIAFHKVI